MAKKALLDVLEQTIGKYVKNLDAESLNVAVWSGKIELNSLELNVDAVNAEFDRQAAEAPNLALPFRVISGGFRSFQVDVPWAKITSKPIVLRARGLQVSVEPYDRLSRADYLHMYVESEVLRAKKILEARLQSITMADEFRRRANSVKQLAAEVEDRDAKKTGGVQENNAQGQSFSARLARRLIENIQIEIEDVHVELKSDDGSAGVVLESLLLVTTDKDGQRTFVDRFSGKRDESMSFLYKILEIRGLGFYLDEERLRSGLAPISEESDEEVDHSYILAPLSFVARLRQADSMVCLDYPKYLLASELTSLSILLSRPQVEIGHKILRAMRPSQDAARPLFPEFRPLSRVTKETATEWWRYAFRCVRRLNNGRWGEFFDAFLTRKKYIMLYKRATHHADNKWIRPLTWDEQVELDSIEHNRSISVEGLMAWRNIADAQVERERQISEKRATENKPSIFSSLFATARDKSKTPDDDPPITLSVEELKELESVGLENVTHEELSHDSKLCDAKFTLGSFKINLISYGMRPIAALSMGTVITSFDANADGSYIFDFSLSGLEINDMVTPKSLFPTILMTLPPSDNESRSLIRQTEAFRLRIAKSYSGDQNVSMKLLAVQAVASPFFLIELKQLFSFSKASFASKAGKQNPILAQSLSGSVDLFYDADTGGESRNHFELSEPKTAAASTASELSTVLIDAWKAKTETKVSWVVDFDIYAPILVIPESCTDPSASVLVFNFGHLRLEYGKIDVSPKVNDWYLKHLQQTTAESTLDIGALRVDNLTFVVGRVGDKGWRAMLRSDRLDVVDTPAVVAPISVQLDIGVESRTKNDIPRLCAYGVIPVVSLSLSPFQASVVLSVYRAWMKVLKELSIGSTQGAEGVAILDQIEPRSPHEEHSSPKLKRRISHKQQPERPSELSTGTDPSECYAVSHVEIALQRLSVQIVGDQGDGIEGHLVSVSAAVSSMSDGATTSSLRMGWFWILDRFENKFPRKQRLLVHSTLPKSPSEISEDGEFHILEDLECLGVLDPSFSGLTDLANITLKTRQGDQGELPPQFWRQGYAFENIACLEVDVSAKFSSLFIHLNPKGLRTLTDRLSEFQVLLQEQTIQEQTIAFVTEISPKDRLAKSASWRSSATEDGTQDSGDKRSKWAIKAELERLEISLNSARDDLPLFLLAMTGSQVRLISAEQNLMAYLMLGDFRLTTFELGRTLSEYRALVGLSPGRNDSLLNIYYCVGSKVIQAVAPSEVDLSRCEAYAKVELSPMRIVHIQAQTMALVQYITEGILGAIAAQAASSAVGAAKEISAAIVGEKVFAVSATAIEVIVPQAAHCQNHFTIHAGALSVTYNLFSSPGGSDAKLLLSKVTLRDSSDATMQEDAVQMNVDVKLPPPVGSNEDQAMLVSIDISKANFLLSKNQYASILRMLDENIGEQDLFLRDIPDEKSQIEDDAIVIGTEKSGQQPEGISNDFLQGINHAGVLTIENPRRLYMNVEIASLSLELRGLYNKDSIICITAVETRIVLKLIPDELKMHTEVSLRNLLCEDKRAVALLRQYRALIEQATVSRNSPDQLTPLQDFFHLSYERDDKQCWQSVDLKVGSPRVVFIPDVVAEVLRFFHIADSPERLKSKNSSVPVRITEQYSLPNMLEVDVSETHEIIETSLAESSNEKFSISTMTISLATSRCSVVLVDLGSQVPEVKLPATHPTQAAETIVLHGLFEASGSYSTSQRTGKIVDANVQAHGRGMEIYSAFGRELKSPLQIMEPAELSVFGYFKLRESASVIDFRAATLSPLDLTLSMQSAALLAAILASVSESLQITNEESRGEDQVPMSNEEKARIEKLARDLDETQHSVRNIDRENSALDESSIQGSSETWDGSSSQTITVKVTMAETKVTFINDLQGIDEALFRFTVRNFVAGCNIQFKAILSDNRYQVLLDCHFLTSILADYFDSSSNLWNVLLNEPWEISLKISREPNRRFRSKRLMTTIDLESYPCYVSFSEQFLVSLAAAKRMWAIYSAAVASAADFEPENLLTESSSLKSLKRSLAARAARNLTTTLPYAVDNHSGIDIAYVLLEVPTEQRLCPTWSIQYFRFEPARGKGFGGKRFYGQDLTRGKSLRLIVGGAEIDLPHLDQSIGLPRNAHVMGNGRCFFTWIQKEGRTTVVHISSCVEVHNLTHLPFAISLRSDGESTDVGVCQPDDANGFSPTISEKGATLVKPSRRFAISVDTLCAFLRKWTLTGEAGLSLVVSPQGILNSGSLEGSIVLKPTIKGLQCSVGKMQSQKFEVICRSEQKQGAGGASSWCDPLAVLIRSEVTLVGGQLPSVEIYIEPRALIENDLPVSLTVRTPMPHTFNSLKSRDKQSRDSDDEVHGVHDSSDTIHEILPGHSIQIFTPGPSIAVTMKCSDLPVGGTPMGWMEGGWIDLPLVSEFRLVEPLRCRFPFVQVNNAGSLVRSGALGTDFFIAEVTSSLEELAMGDAARLAKEEDAESSDNVEVALSGINIRSFHVTVLNYAIDHTGRVLFEQLDTDDHGFRQSYSSSSPQKSSTSNLPTRPLTAFASPRFHSRITLLPAGTAVLRLIYLTMEDDEGMTRSAPFRVEDISICHGGAESTCIKWADGSESGFYAYRRLSNSYQSEIHVIPEFILFNGSKTHKIEVRVQNGGSLTVEPGKLAPLRKSRDHGLIISVEYVAFGVRSPPLRVDSLGLRVAVLMSLDGTALGSLAIQTVIGTCDSRLVVKLGEIKLGGVPAAGVGSSTTLLQNDFVRFRVRWTELRLSLKEAQYSPNTRKEVLIVKSALNRILDTVPPKHAKSWSGPPTSEQNRTTVRGHRSDLDEGTSHAVCTIVLSRFTVDWQRVFKDEATVDQDRSQRSIESMERSQLSVIVHNVQVRDETPGSQYPLVFDSSSPRISFVDLCVRFRGPIDADLIKVDLLDLNVAHVNGLSECIVVKTSEDFIWKLLDLANRLVVATAEVAGGEIQLKWDDRNEEYFVMMLDEFVHATDMEVVRYTPPKSDTLFDIHMAKVSPFTMEVTFKRAPLSSRYKLQKDFRGATLLNYFTRRLKFKIDKAELKFSRYETRNVKGPPDRVFQEFMAVYLARMKLKLVTLMSAASFQDWKFLASRDKGDDEYMEGDLLRVTGNLAGNTAGYIFKNMGRGLGSGVSAMSSTVGDSIENATEMVGAGSLGAGVNSVITGIGDGVGNTIIGVGSGAGKIAKGAGKGIGHVFGGVAGGSLLIVKGIGKGVTTGDGKAVLSGIAEGGKSVSTGLGDGVGTAVLGAADGVLAVGQGLFSGVKSVGMGIGGAFSGCRSGICFCCRCCTDTESTEDARRLESPLLASNATNRSTRYF